MSDIFDYLNWRGDISFNEVKFNTIDALIFAHFSYSSFDFLVPQRFSKGKSISKFASDFKNAPDYKKRTDITFLKNKKTAELTQRLSETKRFKDVKITGFKNSISIKETKQFAAVTFLCEEFIVIAFRGTDDTITGWREDFNIAWQNPIPSESEAISYLTECASSFKGKIIITGHSKGGHLGMYAACSCDKDIQNRIEAVYNFDAPGFSKDFFESKSYHKLSSRTNWIYPSGSIVGMLFHHPDTFEIVESNRLAMKEHNALTWQLMGSDFINKEKFELSSRHFYTSFNAWIEKLSQLQRKKFVTALFDVLEAGEVQTLGELEDNIIPCVTKMLAKLSTMDHETKKEVRKILKLLNKAVFQFKILDTL